MAKIGKLLYTMFLMLAGSGLIMSLAGCEDCALDDISTPVLPDGRIGFAYSAEINLETECTPRFENVWLLGGQLPPGLSLRGDGRIQGTPSRLGDYRFTLAATACFSQDVYGFYDCEEITRGYYILITE